MEFGIKKCAKLKRKKKEKKKTETAKGIELPYQECIMEKKKTTNIQGIF